MAKILPKLRKDIVILSDAEQAKHLGEDQRARAAELAKKAFSVLAEIEKLMGHKQ